MEIIEVKDTTGQILFRHSAETSKLYEAMANYQQDLESFTASTKNAHFKNAYAPLPEMLEAVNRGFKKFGLVQHKLLCGVYLVTRDVHIESGEFTESWSKIPSLETDVNKFKGILTALNRYVTMIDSNCGADVDDDSEGTYGRGTPSTNSKLWVNKEGVTDPNFVAAKKAIEAGEIKSEVDLLSKYAFNANTPTAVKAKSTLVSLIK